MLVLSYKVKDLVNRNFLPIMNTSASDLHAIVLAAGLGTRMRPLTENAPKPLLPICNQPLLEIILNRLTAAGVSQVAVNTHYCGEKLTEWVEASSYADRIRLYPEPEILGTGGPIVNAADFLRRTDCFLIHNGDTLSNVDLSGMIAQHRRYNAAATLLLVDGHENKVRVLPGGVITDIMDKLGADTSKGELLTYGCVMVLSPEVFNFLPAQPQFCSIIPAVLELIRTQPGRVQAWREDGIYWNDLGSIERYFSAHRDILSGCAGRLFNHQHNRLIDPSSSVDPHAVNGFICVGKNCRVEPGAMVENCVIMDNSTVKSGDFYINMVIGPDYAVHRDFVRLAELNILKGRDLRNCCISSLREYGSARGFFRLQEGDQRQVLMVSDRSDADFERFIDIGTFLQEHRLPTPRIFAADRNEFTVLMEDLGNEMLFNRRQKLVDDFAGIENAYRQVISALVHFQLDGTAALKTPGAPTVRVFDYDYLRWETRYFQDNFLIRLCGIDEAAVNALNHELDELAATVDRQIKIFMHRDFQSQNIMFHQDQVRFVDFQGARVGPAGYDIMSLLRDPYVTIPAVLRRRLLDFYVNSMIQAGSEKFGLSEKELYRSARLAGLQRIMQALGAYGFLSLTRGKMRYLQYVPMAMDYLREALDWLNAAEKETISLTNLQQLWPAIASGWTQRKQEYDNLSGQ